MGCRGAHGGFGELEVAAEDIHRVRGGTARFQQSP